MSQMKKVASFGANNGPIGSLVSAFGIAEADTDVNNIKELEELIEKKDGDHIKIKYKDFMTLLNFLKRAASQLDSLTEEQKKLKRTFNAHDHKDGRIITYTDDNLKNTPPNSKFFDEINELVNSMS